MVVSNQEMTLPGLLTADQIDEETEVYLLRAPSNIPVQNLNNLDINLRSPDKIEVGDHHYSPILSKGEKGSDLKTIIMPNRQGKPTPISMQVKGIVTLRESIKVPPVPKIEVPTPYKVPAPGETVLRHPIYGKEWPGMKRPIDDNGCKLEFVDDHDTQSPAKKKKKKKDKKIKKET